MKNITDTALVVSQHDNISQGHSRINLKWQGNHDIADFNLELLGKVVSCETETENTGWVIIERSGIVKIGSTIPLLKEVQ